MPINHGDKMDESSTSLNVNFWWGGYQDDKWVYESVSPGEYFSSAPPYDENVPFDEQG